MDRITAGSKIVKRAGDLLLSLSGAMSLAIRRNGAHFGPTIRGLAIPLQILINGTLAHAGGR